MRKLRSTVLLMLATVCGHSHAQYAALRPVMSAARPEILRQDIAGTLVRFGPVQIAFPPDWQFFAGAVGSEGHSPAGASTSVMVLAGQFTQVPEPVPAITQALSTYFCESGASVRVDPLPQPSDGSAYVGQCVGQHGGHSYALFCEIRSNGRMVQLISTGTGEIGSARQQLDEAVSSVVFQ